MKQHVFEDNIPVTEPQKRDTYDFLKKMEIGQSFTIDKKERNKYARGIFSFEKNNPGYTFTTRVEGEKVRVWRVEKTPTK